MSTHRDVPTEITVNSESNTKNINNIICIGNNFPSSLAMNATKTMVDSELKNNILEGNLNIKHNAPLLLTLEPRKQQRFNYQILFTSRGKNYVLYNAAKPGDIVMSTAYDIKHPAYVEEHSVNNLFGVINIFCYLEGDRFNISKKL